MEMELSAAPMACPVIKAMPKNRSDEPEIGYALFCISGNVHQIALAIGRLPPP